jgi:hypothetical protein
VDVERRGEDDYREDRYGQLQHAWGLRHAESQAVKRRPSQSAEHF